MQVHSLGIQTDLALHRREGLIEEHPDHLVLRTPNNPDFYGGNALVVANLASLDKWEARFDEAFPAALHRAFCVDNRDGLPRAEVLDQARARGYSVRFLAVLTATTETLRELVPPSGHTLRPLEGNDDWVSQQELMRTIDAESGLSGVAHERYLAGYVASRRRWSQEEGGAWWGVFDGTSLLASAGLFWRDGLGRYQDVMTSPDARRRGLASALVSRVGHAALVSDCERVVIVSVDDSDAHRLYRGLGFEVHERYVDLLRSPRVA